VTAGQPVRVKTTRCTYIPEGAKTTLTVIFPRSIRRQSEGWPRSDTAALDAAERCSTPRRTLLAGAVWKNRLMPTIQSGVPGHDNGTASGRLRLGKSNKKEDGQRVANGIRDAADYFCPFLGLLMSTVSLSKTRPRVISKGTSAISTGRLACSAIVSIPVARIRDQWKMILTCV
jgi:hypothetical protein